MGPEQHLDGRASCAARTGADGCLEWTVKNLIVVESQVERLLVIPLSVGTM